MAEFIVRDFPIVIEPMSQVLELQSGMSPQPIVWTQLYRVPTEDVVRGIAGLPTNVVHFFAPDPEFGRSQVILAYSCSGLLSKILRLINDEWDILDAPEELTGAKECYPSVRMIFEDERARDIFLQHLDRVKAGVVKNPTLELVLDRMKEQPRVIAVYSPHEQA